MIAFRLRHAVATVAAAGLMAGCGDGPYEPEAAATTPQTVPASATVSTASYTVFAASLAVTETGEPLSVDGVTPPTSESEEGAAVN